MPRAIAHFARIWPGLRPGRATRDGRSRQNCVTLPDHSRSPDMPRTLMVLGVVTIALADWTLAPRPRAAVPLHFAISFPAARSAQPLDGRVLLFISDDGKTEPRTQTDQYRANSTRPIFGVDVDGLKPGTQVVIDDRVAGWPLKSIKDIP